MRQLGTDALTWRDLHVIIVCARPDSALSRAVRGDEWQWQLSEYLLADAADSLRWLVWSKTKDARRHGATPPKPIPRPGLDDGRERIGDQAMSLAEADAFLGWKGGP
uniref:DUF5361 domain-containing protein n=1 Tax=Nocardia suismassiliense TaxID=2077092 RepID=UPI003F49A509